MTLIQKIKAIESIPTMKKSFFDLSKTAGHQLLSEMSIVELKERLSLLRDHQDQEMGAKHDEIIQGKINKSQSVIETLSFINKFRSEIKNKHDKKPDSERSMRSQSEIRGLNEKLLMLKVERGKSKENACVSNKILESSHQALHLLYLNQRVLFSIAAKDCLLYNWLAFKKQLETNRFSDIEVTQERVVKSQLII